MRVISKTKLSAFWEQYPDAKTGLLHWFEKITSKEQKYEKPSDIIADFKGADYVGGKRIVFDIAKNKYRLVVLFIFQTQICYVRFVGKHEEYDKITNIQEI